MSLPILPLLPLPSLLSLPIISNEQQNIVDILKNGKNIIVNAVAGSGKTSVVLHIGIQNPNLRILQITYNSELKIEVRNKVQSLSINNIDVHSYHSLATTFYDKSAHTDIIMHNICKNNKQISANKKHNNKYDIIIIDELQDATKLYCTFFKKFIIDSNNINSQFMFIGDSWQCI